MNNDYNNGQNGQNQQGQGPQDFGRSQEARQAWENGQTSWANQGTPYSNVPQTPEDPSANTARTLGIIGLIVSIFGCCGVPAGLVLGIIALVKAKRSCATLGFEVPEARTGRICGLLAIIFTVVALVICLIINILAELGLLGMYEWLRNDLTAVVSFLPLL